jgi:XTP/dITP diphosphohydrolase
MGGGADVPATGAEAAPRRVLVVATRNEHKLRELAEVLADFALRPLPAEVELPPEDGDSFAANALIKARAAREATGAAAIADDSGIEAEDLGGRPGIRSARYAGEDAGDEENLAKLLREVEEAGGDRRVAYVCALALVGEDGAEEVFEGRTEGSLIAEPRGSGGFGYDPAVVPDDTGEGDRRTMAELSPAEKNEISHRGRAARLLAAHLSGHGPAAGGGAP